MDLQPQPQVCSNSDENDQDVSSFNHVHRLCLPLQKTCQRIQALLSADSRQVLILHRSKCYSLAEAYAVGVEQAHQQIQRALTNCPSTICAAAENLTPSLTALHLAMKEGENFIRSCMKENHWLKKALTLALSSEAIDVHFIDLFWSVCVLGATVGRILGECTDLDDRLVQSHMQMGGDVWQILSGNDTAHVNQQTEQQQANAINSKSVDSKDGKFLIYGLLKDAMSKTCADEDMRLVLDALKDVKNTVGLSSPSATIDQVESRLADFLFNRLSTTTPLKCIPEGKLEPYLWVDRQEFKILGLIGNGSYAAVYKVQWLGEHFAMKEFSNVSRMFSGGGITALFQKEAALQAYLQHPNVVQLICCTENLDRSHCGLVMELMQEDLGSFIAKRKREDCVPPLPLPIALDIMLQIAKGMEYLHSQGIMHRDLKSFNVLVTGSGSHQELASDTGQIAVKISDFGMAKAKCRSSQYSTMRTGTTYWRAPEVFGNTLQQLMAEEDSTDVLHKSEAHRTKKADVYSFAMVCYEILTGKIPFQDHIKVTRSMLIRGVRPVLPPSCPQILHRYIAKCWHTEASQRPPFAEICRTLRCVKGVLLTLADPMLSLTQFSDPLVGKLVQLVDIPTAGAHDIPSNAGHPETCPSSPVALANVSEVGSKNREGHTAEDSADVSIAKTSHTGDRSVQYCIHLRKFFLRYKHRVDKSELPRVRILEKFGSCRRREDKSVLGILTSSHSELKKPPAEGLGTSSRGAKVLGIDSDLKMFTVEELRTATEGFSKVLGEGGYGAVFWGRFPNGQEVAVKRLSDIPADQFDELGVVVRELRTVGLLHHSNLVPLHGWCLDSQNNELLLVYDFMPNGSLDTYLYNNSSEGSGHALEWEQRYKIVCGLAAALHYLHDECGGPHGVKVVHRDVKPSNVLLDAELNALLGDFGLAKLLEQKQVHYQELLGRPNSFQVAGTIGYMDPQYILTGELGTHSDVYSFGVVVLEVACGRRVIDRRQPRGQPFLIPWLRKLPQKDRATHAADPKLEGVYNKKQMHTLLHVGLWCTQQEAELRPTMAKLREIFEE